MAAQMGVLGLILSFSPYLRSAVGRFPLYTCESVSKILSTLGVLINCSHPLCLLASHNCFGLVLVGQSSISSE